MQRSLFDVVALKSPSYVGPGLGKLNHPESYLRESGQAHLKLDNYQDRVGSNKAHAKSGRWVPGHISNQAQIHVKRRPLLENIGPGQNNNFIWEIKQET